MDIKIIPAINVTTHDEFVHQLRSVENVVDTVQIDIADGDFTPWENWHDPDLIAQMHTRVNFELHLMVEEPRKEMNRWGRLENLSRIIIHAESKYPPVEVGAHNVLLDTMPTFFAYGADVCVALSPETPVSTLEPLMEHLYSVLILGVTPGRSGQTADIHLLRKIEAVRNLHPTINIAVDGGLNEENIPDVIRAGANTLCLGSAIFGSGNPVANIKRLQNLANSV